MSEQHAKLCEASPFKKPATYQEPHTPQQLRLIEVSI